MNNRRNRIICVLTSLLILTSCSNSTKENEKSVIEDMVTVGVADNEQKDNFDSGKKYTCVLEPSIRERYTPNGDIKYKTLSDGEKQPVFADCKCYEVLDSKELNGYNWIQINDLGYLKNEEELVWIGTKPDWIKESIIYSDRTFDNPNMRYQYSENGVVNYDDYLKQFSNFVEASDEEYLFMKLLKQCVPGLTPSSNPFVEDVDFDDISTNATNSYMMQMDMYGLNPITYETLFSNQHDNLVYKYLDEIRFKDYGITYVREKMDDNGNVVEKSKEEVIFEELEMLAIYPQEHLDYYSNKYYGTTFDYEFYSSKAILYDSDALYYVFPTGLYGWGTEDSFPYVKSISKNGDETKVVFSYAPVSMASDGCCVNSNLDAEYKYVPITNRNQIIDFFENTAKSCEATFKQNGDSYVLKAIKKLNY